MNPAEPSVAHGSSRHLAANAVARQLSTFFVAGRLYGIDVTNVQEIVRTLPMTVVPLSPTYVRGLINLRGQVATAIGLRELFDLPDEPVSDLMNVVCKNRDCLISLLVDEIGDVIEVQESDAVAIPQTIPANIRQFMSGVYRVSDELVSILDTEQIFNVIDGKAHDAIGETK